MSIKNRFQKLENRTDLNDQIGDVTYALCKTFGWDYHTLMNQPIPFVTMLLDKMKKESQEIKKQQQK